MKPSLSNPFRKIRFIPMTERFAVEGFTHTDYASLADAQAARDALDTTPQPTTKRTTK